MLVLQAAYNSTLNRPPCPQSRTWCIRSLPGREVPTHIPTQLANQERKHGLGQAEAPSQHDSDPAYFRRQRLTWVSHGSLQTTLWSISLPERQPVGPIEERSFVTPSTV